MSESSPLELEATDYLRSLGGRIATVSTSADFIEVSGVKLVSWLSHPDRQKIIKALNEVVFRHRLVVFRDQDVVAAHDQVEISKWFNPLECTFYKHPMSPHPEVFRVSNDPSQGCTGVGRTGWHVDGSFQPSPFSHALYHIVECPTKGATSFLPLEEFLDSLKIEDQFELAMLMMLSDRRSTGAKPLCYTHPKTGRRTMCFHLGMINGFIKRFPPSLGAEDVEMSPECTQAVLDKLEKLILGSEPLIYTHHWRPGDFIITDNCAIAHEATPETQLPVEEVGLRVLHRTTTRGWVGNAAPRFPELIGD